MYAHGHVCLIGDSWLLTPCNSSNYEWNCIHCTLLLQQAQQAVPFMYVLSAATPNSPLHRSGFGGGAAHLTYKGPNRHNPETSDEVNWCCCCKSSTLEVHKLMLCLLHFLLALKYSSVFLHIDINTLCKSHKLNMSYLLKQKGKKRIPRMRLCAAE